MALKKKQIQLDVMQSTDQITADKMSMAPSEIENIRYEKRGEAKKRLGVKYLDSVSGESTIVGINESTYIGCKDGFYGIDKLTDEKRLITDDPYISMGVKRKKVFSSGNEIRYIASARGENYHFVIYRPLSNSSVVQETKAYLLDDDFNVVKDLTSTSTYLRNDFDSCQAVSYTKNGYEYVSLLVQDSTSGVVRGLEYDQNGDLQATNTSVLSASSGETIAAVSTGTGYYVAGINSSNQFILVLYDGSTHVGATGASTGFNNYGVGSLSWFSDYVVATINPSDPSGATTAAQLVIISLASWPTSIGSPSQTSLSLSGGSFYTKWATTTKVDNDYHLLCLTEYDSSTVSHNSYIQRLGKSATVLTGGIFTQRTSTIGQAYVDGDYGYVMTMTQNGYNPIYHMLRMQISPGPDYYYNLISFLSGEAPTSEFYANGMVGQNPVEGEDQYLFRSQPQFSVVDNKLYTVVPSQALGDDYASWTALEFELNRESKSDTAENVSIVASGVFSAWDGMRFLRGVTAYPEIIASTAGSGNNYLYAVLHRIVDGNGNVRKSLVSPPYQASFTNPVDGINTATVTISRNALLFNDYPSTSNQPLQGAWEIYRTEKDGTIFYKVGELTGSTGSVFTDSTADADLIDNELLYTTGGVLDNTYPESVYDFTYSNGRVWTIGDRDRIHYSKEPVDGNSIEFNDGLFHRIAGTNNTAIGKLGKRQAVFKKRSTHIMWGVPASNIGTGQNLSDQEVSNSIGCINPVSAVEIDSAVIFLSEKGIYTVSSNGGIQFVGKDVIDYTNTYEITSGFHLEDFNEVHYSLSNGQKLIYNYLFGGWAIDTYTVAQDLIYSYKVGDVVYFKDNTSSPNLDFIYRYKNSSDSNIYRDLYLSETDYAMSYSTGWLKFGGVTGFQRIYRLFILGSKTVDQNIIVKVYNDYDDSTPTQTRSFTLAAADPLEFELHVAEQKCEAMKFVIEEDISTVTNSDLVINALSIQVGVKKGFNKLSPDLRR